MINGIKPLPSTNDFDGALNTLVENIHRNYVGGLTMLNIIQRVKELT